MMAAFSAAQATRTICDDGCRRSIHGQSSMTAGRPANVCRLIRGYTDAARKANRYEIAPMAANWERKNT